MTSPADRDRNREPYNGGADAVNDTPHVPGHGTEPGSTERRAGPRGPASGTGGGGLPLLGWVAILLAIVLIAIYGFGFFRG